MRYVAVIIVSLALALYAEDAPKATSEQQIADLQQKLAEAQVELRLYQQGLFQCQADQIHAKAKEQVQRAKDAPK